jgi:hypothetical protein
MTDLGAAIIEVLYKKPPMTPEEIKVEIKRLYDYSASINDIKKRIAELILSGELEYSK